MAPTPTPTLTEHDTTLFEEKRRRGDRIALIALAVIALLVVSVYVVLHFSTSDRVPAGTTIGGVELGMKPIDEARTTLGDTLAAPAKEPVRIVRGKKTFELTPDEAGLAVDLDTSIAQTGADTSVWNPLTMLDVLFGAESYDVAVAVDDKVLESAVASIADDTDREVSEGRIGFTDGKPKVSKPKAGRAVDQKATTALVRSSYPLAHTDLELPVDVLEPAVSVDDLRAAVTEIAKPAMSAPVKIVAGSKSAELAPSDYAPALSVQVKDGKLTTVVDPKKLAEPLAEATEEIGTPAQDATVAIRSGKPVVVPGKAGIGVVPADVATALVPVLQKSGAERAVEVEPKQKAPDLTTKEVEKLGIVEKVSSFSTNYPHADYRNTNQGRAAELVNGTLLKPGETFSFNETVGERTVANGFTAGTMISNGVFREDLGGGVSQVATTLYNAGFFAGLEDVTHKPHSFYISRYPVGREATVAWPSVDLKFKNTTDHGILIQAWVNRSTPGRQGSMNVTLWGTKQWDIKSGLSSKRNFRSPATRYDASDECLPQAGVTGFDVDVYRTFTRDGAVVKRETTTAKYNAADNVECRKAPGDE
ncbi:VanW family protein [Mumia sp. zg.B53]|uniref:VanW family protein n=1 Tax=unclassified Mumia TaxID=2621872 RepID=UPI001C6F4EFF|nr:MULTISPECIES: VanW family protein [unclassified Mumia]MBW9210907.1 VanW family protein [Mumia sp. zg.B21]MBW9215473.1 VanW family protein [Mumia sp. zg.B53]